MPTGLSVYAKRWLCPAQSWCIAGALVWLTDVERLAARGLIAFRKPRGIGVAGDTGFTKAGP